jgi:hypothetical protein
MTGKKYQIISEFISLEHRMLMIIIRWHRDFQEKSASLDFRKKACVMNRFPALMIKVESISVLAMTTRKVFMVRSD